MKFKLNQWAARTIAVGLGALTAWSALGPSEALSGELEQVGNGPSEAAQAAVAVLSPDVRSFIQDTYLFHAADLPDANESVNALRAYLEGNELLTNGDLEGALYVFSRAVAAHPESRHVRAGYGYALWARYERTQQQSDLRRAISQLSMAAEMGMNHGKVRYTDILSRALVATREGAQLDRLFQRAFRVLQQPGVGNSLHSVTLDYAKGLAGLGRPEAGQYFQQARQVAPAGNIDALSAYGEWLLDTGRNQDVLATISPQAEEQYLHFLRGVALDRLGQFSAAVAEYAQYAEFSDKFPAPARFRVAASVGQQDVTFEDDLFTSTHCAGHTRLSIMLYCEARGESEGGQRLVGWTARKRVFRGTISGCISINNSGSTLCDQYYNVIGQSGQFYIGCGTRSATSDHVAHDVFNGYANDPLSGYCAGSSTTSTTCDGAFHCPGGTSGAGVHSPVWFDLGCTASTTCKHNHGTLCGNDNVGNDHCFYNNH